MSTKTDQPKLLRDPVALEERRAQLHAPHIRPLTEFVRALRQSMPDAAIPNFDPWDGGIEAEVLYLLEAPGPKARDSTFVSRNNPDETAKNFFQLNEQAGIPRTATVTWNVVPWYIGSDVKICPAQRRDIAQAMEPLVQLLGILQKLRIVVLFGRKAETIGPWLRHNWPDIQVFIAPHPSPMCINRSRPLKWLAILSELAAVRSALQRRLATS